MFDTFYDRRNGFMLYTNPLGARNEYSVVDEAGVNRDWNPIWDVAPGRFDGGWTVEIAIPFKSLRYQSGAGQMWGLQLRRSIRHLNEWDVLEPGASHPRRSPRTQSGFGRGNARGIGLAARR